MPVTGRRISWELEAGALLPLSKVRTTSRCRFLGGGGWGLLHFRPHGPIIPLSCSPTALLLLFGFSVLRIPIVLHPDGVLLDLPQLLCLMPRLGTRPRRWLAEKARSWSPGSASICPFPSESVRASTSMARTGITRGGRSDAHHVSQNTTSSSVFSVTVSLPPSATACAVADPEWPHHPPALPGSWFCSHRRHRTGAVGGEG